jgi:hypothetical protein
MYNEALNEVVVRLFDDRRFLRRFRRNPERALRGYRLDAREVEALKRGDTRELLELGLRPTLVWPELRPAVSPVSTWLLQSRRRLAPAALLLALFAAAPATASAARGRMLGPRAARRIASGRFLGRGRVVRLMAPHSGRARAARVRAGRYGGERAFGRARVLLRTTDAA